MIARREHPDQPGKYVYVPLRMADDGTWEPMAGDKGFFHHAIDAGKVSVDQVRRRFREIAKQTRILRALCEHPHFDFQSDGLDSDMIRENATMLSRLVFTESDNVARLLSEPNQDDDIVIGGVCYDLDAEEDVIEPRLGERPRYRPLAGTAWEEMVENAPESQAYAPPEGLLTATRTHLALAEQIIVDAISSLEEFGNRVVTGRQSDEAIPRTQGYGMPEKGAMSLGGDPSKSLATWLTAARSYLRITDQHIVDAISSVVALRKKYEKVCQAAQGGGDARCGADVAEDESRGEKE